VSFWQEFNERLRALALALGVHGLMAALVVLGTMSWEPFRKPQNVGLTIEAVIVDTTEIKKQRDAAKQAMEMEDRRRQRNEKLERQKQREQEQKKQRDKDAAEQRKKELELQKKRNAQDKLQKLRMERERKLEDERLKQQRELDQVRAEREAAEKQRKIDEERLKQIESRRENELVEQQRLQREAAAQRQADAEAREFRSGQRATLSDNYQAAIQSVVTQNWLRPPTAQAGLRCKLKIVQIPGGEVISAAISGKCNGDEATRRSILAAVERGGALPYRGFEDVFQREIDFIFIYDGD
jgi:colicin import membrane protein